MAASTTIENRLAQAGDKLSPGRRRLIHHTLESPDETYFLSSRALARRYKVDPATIVRTIQALGYKRYADFAADLRAHFVSRITPYRILEASVRERRSAADHISHSIDKDVANMEALRSALDPHAFVALARRIHASRRVLVVGADIAHSLAWFLAYGLLPLGFNIEAPVPSSGNLHHKVRILTPKDLLIAISFGRCLRETVLAVERASAQRVPTFGITDSDTTAIARKSDSYLLAPIGGDSFAGSYAAPMALLNGILVACAQVRPKKALVQLRQSEEEYTSGPRWFEKAPANDNDPKRRSTRSS
jgi:DNA-binding MurR/RpiR family transcriptional regulator